MGRDKAAFGLNERSEIRISTLILFVYLVFLPISTALSGFITSSSIQTYVALLYVGVAFLEMFITKKFEFDKNLSIVYLFFIYMIVTSLWNRYFAIDWYLLQFIVIFLIIFCVSTRSYSDAEMKLIKYSLYFSFVVVMIATLFFSFMHGGRMYIEIFSLMDPNDFACGLALVFGLCLTELKGARKIVLNGVILVTIMIIVYFTGSRGGLLTMLCMTFVWVLSIKGRRKYQFLLVMAGAVALLLFCAENGIGPSLIKRFSISSLIKSGGTGRLNIWKAAMKVFWTQSPFHILFGNGHGAFYQSVRYVAIGKDYWYAAHNMYVNELIEGGLLGMGLLIGCFATLYIYAARRRNVFGILALTGFLVSGISLDSQVYRTFAIAVAMAIIWRPIDCDILNRDKDPLSKEQLENENP